MKKLLLLVTLIPFISQQKVKPITPKTSQICEYELKMREQGLVNIQEIDPNILVELKYSTTDNLWEKTYMTVLQTATYKNVPPKCSLMPIIY